MGKLFPVLLTETRTFLVWADSCEPDGGAEQAAAEIEQDAEHASRLAPYRGRFESQFRAKPVVDPEVLRYWGVGG